MAQLDLWITALEGLAILLLTGSILLMAWGRRSGLTPGIPAETLEDGSLPLEELKRLVAESQVLSQELVNNLHEKKILANHLVEQMDEKIGKLTWLLNRPEGHPDPLPETDKPPAYLEAIELADEGRSPAEIGKRLNLSRGEVQTLLDLKAYCLK